MQEFHGGKIEGRHEKVCFNMRLCGIQGGKLGGGGFECVGRHKKERFELF